MAAADLRTAIRATHRWIGVTLMALMTPIALSGALLVFDDELDALVHPARYAVGGEATLAPSLYLANAAAAVPADMQVTLLRYPADADAPVTAMARGTPGGGPPRVLTVYLDPQTARILDVGEFRNSFVGMLHRFHENLTIPEYSGRQIVGWAGVGLFALSLSGLFLWWPRKGTLLLGLRWRRAPETVTNLHHLIGFWISLPLAAVSLTGIYLAFPPQARAVMSSVAAMTPAQRPGFSPVARDLALTADHALAAALAVELTGRPLAIFLPPALRPSNAAGGQAAGPSWRIQLRTAVGDSIILVNDKTGATIRLPPPLSGDRAAQWIRWIHEGSHSGPIWRLIVAMTGLFPAALAATGAIMWWRGRRRRLRMLSAVAQANATL